MGYWVWFGVWVFGLLMLFYRALAGVGSGSVLDRERGGCLSKEIWEKIEGEDKFLG